MINHEIKGNLARLLATEDLVVEHKKVSTACFNVQTRVLTLPIWDKASNVVYDMLVGHEVGHALYTPNEDWGKVKKIPKSFVNITEDIRIEKLMKRKYGGLNKIFYAAYSELHDEDFFCIGSDDIKKYNLADRINLHFKIGNFLDVTFSQSELSIVEKANEMETFEDAVHVAELIYNFCCEEQKQIQDNVDSFVKNSDPTNSKNAAISGENIENSSPKDTLDDDGGNEVFSDEQDSVKNTDSLSQKSAEENNGEPNTNGPKEPEVVTDRNFSENIQKLVDPNCEESDYVEIPKVDLSKLIISPEKFHAIYEDHIKLQDWTEYDKYYEEYKKTAQTEVSYLVKEFECKKSADEYSRATVSRTGVLDTKKLHTYKYNEDLFKKVTNLPNGKNHGLIFILDWSGSMSNTLLKTVKQLLNIIWFCKKTGIDFEVYAFSDSYFETEKNSYGDEIKVIPSRAYERAEHYIAIDPEFKLFNILSSKTKLSSLNRHMKNIFKLAYYFSCGSDVTIPEQISLSSTPLNEAIACLHDLIPNFASSYKVQKVHCVILTDGEANKSKYHKMFDCYSTAPKYGIRRIERKAFLRNRRTGRIYAFSYNDFKNTEVFIQSVRDAFPEVNFIGIRLLGYGDSYTFIRTHFPYEQHNQAKSELKKQKSLVVTTSGYHKYFGIMSNSLSSQVNFTVQPGASKSTIISQFKNSLNAKKLNKKFLSEFVNLIA